MKFYDMGHFSGIELIERKKFLLWTIIHSSLREQSQIHENDEYMMKIGFPTNFRPVPVFFRSKNLNPT